MEDAQVLAPLDLPNVTPVTQKRIHEFQETLRQITVEIAILASGKSPRKWIINYDRDASKLSALKQRVVDAITAIELGTVVATGHQVDIISQKQDFAHEDQQAIIQKQDLAYQEQQGPIRKQQEAEINRLIALLGNGDSGSSKKPPCLNGTRASLLQWITRWIESSDDGKRSLCPIGAAGRGKSSVGASVAEQERGLEHLSAEFYFALDQKDRNEGVIPVLARQLASWQGGKLRNEIASAIHADCDIAQRRLEVQFRKLIQELLETLTNGVDLPKLVIILDGLDECDNEYAHRLLNLIGESFPKLSTGIKFILTSWPEPHLLHRYRLHPMSAQLEIRSLDLEAEVGVEGDINKFFKQTLPVTVLVKDSSNWPGDKRRKALVQPSEGLWIFEVTVARMLAEPKCHDPEELLDTLLDTAPGPHRVEHNSNLDSIYSRILMRACPPYSTILDLFRDVLGALCVLAEPINIHTLTSLIYPDRSGGRGFTIDIRTKVLAYLQAVLIVPDVDEDDPSRDAKPIRFVHKSFLDHLADKSRCDPRFLVNIAEEHQRMAIRCLRHMEDLRKPNICDIDPNMLNDEIGRSDGNSSNEVNNNHHDSHTGRANDDAKGGSDERVGSHNSGNSNGNNIGGNGDERLDIQDLIQRHISSALQYACRNWSIHVSQVSPECDDVSVAVDNFVKTRLLYWLEVLGLLGLTGRVTRLVEPLEAWLKAGPQQVAPIPSESPSLILPRRIATVLAEGLQAELHLRPNMVRTLSGPLQRALGQIRRILLPAQRLDVPSRASALPTEPDISILNLLQDLKNFVTEF
ncbi:hypothetical protein FRB94_013989 [Tulasnella sp. JGI-2019a]|nr:hypothetical protein FRB94_013989 [Tulasnella sp. JGI-2019a]